MGSPHVIISTGGDAGQVFIFTFPFDHIRPLLRCPLPRHLFPCTTDSRRRKKITQRVQRPKHTLPCNHNSIIIIFRVVYVYIVYTTCAYCMYALSWVRHLCFGCADYIVRVIFLKNLPYESPAWRAGAGD